VTANQTRRADNRDIAATAAADSDRRGLEDQGRIGGDSAGPCEHEGAFQQIGDCSGKGADPERDAGDRHVAMFGRYRPDLIQQRLAYRQFVHEEITLRVLIFSLENSNHLSSKALGQNLI